MGADFSALLEYRGVDAAIARTLTRLESGYQPPELGRVVELGIAQSLAFARKPLPVVWQPVDDCERRIAVRPPLPDPSVQLSLQSGFFIALGADSIWIYHLLRWNFFCKDAHWQEVMVAAVNWFREAFGATDAIITWDFSLPICEFQRGISFDRALAEAVDYGELEVDTPDQLQSLEEEDSDLANEPRADGKLRERRWPRDETLPAGWYRPRCITHNRGWWRPPRPVPHGR